MSTEKYYGLFERGELGFDTAKMSWVHWAAALLAVVTGTIHVYLYVQQGFVPFLFAAVVFYLAVVALLLNVYRRLLYALGVPFVAGQIVLWVAQGMPDMSIAVIDKPVQVVLLLLLGYLFFEGSELRTR